MFIRKIDTLEKAANQVDVNNLDTLKNMLLETLKRSRKAYADATMTDSQSALFEDAIESLKGWVDLADKDVKARLEIK